MKLNLENVSLLANQKLFSKDECFRLLAVLGPNVRKPLGSDGIFNNNIANHNRLVAAAWTEVLSRPDFTETELLKYALKPNSASVLELVVSDNRVSWKNAEKLALEYTGLWKYLASKSDLPLDKLFEIAFVDRKTEIFDILFSRSDFRKLSATQAFAYAEKFDDFVLWREVFKNHPSHLLILDLEKSLKWAKKINVIEVWLLVLKRPDLEVNRAAMLADSLGFFSDDTVKAAEAVLSRSDLTLSNRIHWAKKWSYYDDNILTQTLRRPEVAAWLAS